MFVISTPTAHAADPTYVIQIFRFLFNFENFSHELGSGTPLIGFSAFFYAVWHKHDPERPSPRGGGR